MTNATLDLNDYETTYDEYATAPCCGLCAAELPEGEPEWTHKGAVFCSWQCWNSELSEELWQTDMQLFRQGLFFNRAVHYALSVSGAVSWWASDALLAACESAERGRRAA